MDHWGFIRATTLCVLLCGMGNGCSRPANQQDPLRAEAARLLNLPGTHGTSHLQLQQELARLSQQQHLPKQLAASTGPEATNNQPYVAFINAYPALTRPAVRHEINSL